MLMLHRESTLEHKVNMFINPNARQEVWSSGQFPVKRLATVTGMFAMDTKMSAAANPRMKKFVIVLNLLVLKTIR